MDSSIEFSFLLNSCLDIFDIRQKQASIDQDLGLLQAFDERLAAYGWLTNTGIKFIVILDLFGQPGHAEAKEGTSSAMAGLRDSELKPVRHHSFSMGFTILLSIDHLPCCKCCKFLLLISKQGFPSFANSLC